MAFGYEYEGGELTVVIESESGGIEQGNGFEGEHVHFVCEDGVSCTIGGKTLGTVATGNGGTGPDERFVAGDNIGLDTSEVGDHTELRIRWEEPAPQGKTVIIGVWRGPAA